MTTTPSTARRFASASPRIGSVRTLTAAELPLLREHLLRLDPESRRQRFNGAVDNDFLTRYAMKNDAGAIIIGYFQDGVVRGAAELHRGQDSGDGVPEIAFSVERAARRFGIGSILFEKLLKEARQQGYARLRVTTNAENEAMRALARKFGTRLTFREGELTGLLDLAPAQPGSSGTNPASGG
jgi:GNAT superfamily N-acetyltransferase